MWHVHTCRTTLYYVFFSSASRAKVKINEDFIHFCFGMLVQNLRRAHKDLQHIPSGLNVSVPKLVQYWYFHTSNPLFFFFFMCIDLNEDGILNEEEFSDPDLNEVPEDLTEEQFRLERLDEFRVADEDKNGKLERHELLVSIV